LKYLLFKPAAQYLQGEEKKETNMTGKISTQKNILDSKLETKAATWKKYQATFQKTCPKPITKKIVSLGKERAEPEVVEISAKEANQIAEQVKDAFVERIQHVRD